MAENRLPSIAAKWRDQSRATPFVVPDLCNVTAVTLLVLFGELLVIVLLFAGGELSWIRLALMSLLVQWIGLMSAGVLCMSRPWLSRMPLVYGALTAFVMVLVITLLVGLLADRVLVGQISGTPVNWDRIAAQQIVAGIITGLALRYFYVQQRLRAQEQAELQSRIQALQSRIRPHFLFNSMNIIASLIAVDPDTAEVVVEDLSELFRASLNDAGNRVLLEDELDLCERYVRIEALRLGDRLTMEWDIEPSPGAVRIPLLTLQPLLENAIYHGIQPLPDGGTIALRLWYSDDAVHIQITNPVAAPELQGGTTSGNRMAIANIQSRLQALYGDRASLAAGAEGDSYVTRLKFPRSAGEEGAG